MRQVFLSHTSELREYPRGRSFVAAAEAAVSRAGDAVTDMAYFTARAGMTADYCRLKVSSADVYIGIIGFRYGSCVPGEPALSYTELEFEIAGELGLSRLIFLLDEEADVPLPASRIIDLQHGARQADFRRRLREEAGHTIAKVASPADLETRLYQGLIELASTDRVGDAGLVGTSVAVPIGRLPVEVRGREALLVWLRKRRGLVVLTGMGGVGKSTVAAELARLRQTDSPVWWVSAADASSLGAGIVTVARTLGASEADLRALAARTRDGPDRLWALLEQAPEDWVLVLDNADQAGLLAVAPAAVNEGTGWVRASRRGLVLVTSRLTEPETWSRQAQVHRLASLDNREAARMLIDLAPNAGDQTSAEALGDRLGGLPLALHLAGTYLRSGLGRWSSFTSYRHALDFEPGAAPLLQPDPDVISADDPRATVVRTWELSLEDLARKGLPHARTVLRLLACFAPGIPIPMEVVNPAGMTALLPALSAATSPQSAEMDRRVEQALRGLVRLDLIQVVPDQAAVTLHPVIADTYRTHVRNVAGSDPDPALVWRTAIELLTITFGRLQWTRPGDWREFGRLIGHLMVLHRVPDAYLDAEHLTMLLEADRRACLAHSWCGTLPEAADLTPSATTHTTELGEDQSAILAGRNRLWQMAGHQVRLPEAEAALRRVIDDKAKSLGDDHPETLNARHNLLRVFFFQDQTEQAVATAKEILAAKRRVFGDFHPEAMSAWFSLAVVTARHGRWAEAEAGYRGLLKAQQWLEPDHPATLFARHQIAWTIAHQERWDEAEALLKAVVGDRRRLAGDVCHPTLASRHELACVVAGQRRWAQAEASFREILDAKRYLLGDDHLDTLATWHNLGWTLVRRGRREEAATIFRLVLDRKRSVIGEEHAITSTTRRALDALDPPPSAERRPPTATNG